MDLSVLSFAALVAVISVSWMPRVNAGILALGASWVIGFYLAGMPIHDVVHFFPFSLFITLFGVTLFFGLASANGTLDRLSHLAVLAAKGKARNLPIIFFLMALVLSTIGPGNIGAVALLAPLAMTVGKKSGISGLMMTVMLVSGANAGTFSPFAVTGIISNGLIANLGLVMNPWTQVYLPSLLIQTGIAFVSYVVFSFYIKKKGKPLKDFDSTQLRISGEPWSPAQQWTLVAIVALVVGTVLLRADVGYLAIGLGAILTLSGAADTDEAMKIVPWSVIMMVCGLSSLIAVLEQTGGLSLFVSFLAKISNPQNVTGVMAFVAGFVSIFSSSSGVVLPTFIPTVLSLIEKIGGGNPVAVIASINVGSHVVDVSPLSTLGALCIAAAAYHENKQKLFRHLLIYGFLMTFFGAAVCYLSFGFLDSYRFHW
jgi:di/tricarboxylate transporter